MSIMPGFEGVPPEEWEALLRASEAPPGPPAPPAFVQPTLAQPPASTFRSRLADALAALPAPQMTPGTTGGQAALSGLLSGAARGFAGQTKARESREEKVRQESNALARAESDRNWQSAQATYRAKLTQHYRTEADQRGKVRVTKKMAQDMGVPEAIGTFVDPIQASERITGRLNALRPLSRQPAPKPAPRPKEVSPTEKRRTMVAGVVSDLTARGMGDPAGLRAYYNQPGVAAKLAEHGITLADLLRAVPE